MSEQILLQGKILGIEPFLVSGEHAAGDEALVCGKSQWLTLISEVLPRALLAEFGLSRMLLGSSGGGQFLLVLPGEARHPSEAFLTAAAKQVRELGGGHLKLLWGITENLGDWSVVRRRLNDELLRKRHTPLDETGAEAFLPLAPSAPHRHSGIEGYFAELGDQIRETASVGWSPDRPAMVTADTGRYSWTLSSNLSLDGIILARHAALSDDGKTAADVATLARRAQGKPLWGVLRGDVDHFAIRLRRLHAIEEQVQVSVLYKQFFAGELEVLCSMPEFWRKVTILYSGGDDFAVYGSWDALILLAREVERLFHRFTEENLKDLPGPEAKTISMAMALAPEPEYPLAAVYAQAGANLEMAKASDKDCIYLLGRVLEWKRLADAAELKDTIAQMLAESRSSRQFLAQLRGFYEKEIVAGGSPEADAAIHRLGRFQRRFHRALGGSRDHELQKLRAHLVNEIVGKKSVAQAAKSANGAKVKLRPAGLVAMEWARLASEV